MKERPILFNGKMVKAILEGRKTQTRRVLKEQPPLTNKEIMPLYTMEPEPKVTEVTMHEVMENEMPFPSSISRHKCPYGKIGDRLWVRETTIISPPKWLAPDDFLDRPDILKDSKGEHRVVQYIATNPDTDVPVKDYKLKKTPSIHMPRWASRILLEIINIRVERLQDISEEDAVSEGMVADEDYCAEEQFSMLWTKTYGWGEKGWNVNPWVWVVEFKVIEGK